MTGGQPTTLLDLPVDVIALILTPLLKIDAPIELCPCPDHGDLNARLETARLVLLVHPQLHAIACPMLYSLNTFKLAIVSGRHGALQSKMLQAHCHEEATTLGEAWTGLRDGAAADGALAAEQERQREMGKLRLFVTPSARRRVRNFVLEVGRHRGWIDRAVTPVLSDMILAGSLASLSITLLYQASETRLGGNQLLSRDAAMFTRPPLKGFFQALADPDLESSRLLLTGGHPPAWCKYHKKGLRSDRRGAKCPPVAEVDWRAIVREVLDPEGVNTAARHSEAAPTPHLGRI
ncbi:hypothetical protein ISF_08383 [Cordyceps fumosorosea ARSEF 2679]|uniref:Uncharacterized protein n=1 Tax=Cordyceps fumosorosea (strain ARSEF 2679) TaxID=1081104 RepID=A0A162IAM5_CORFA|nr:hypothetical protein ISF_08383 [Cordyceps fumosorosea ARSEF 2679]OAA54455.1 hypothetical protein ISF_08383 [Cordyceps fumosorosea ARSEF 2679]